MTTIRQLIESSPKRANELFARLVDTSDTAVKTRDRLFSELKDELELQARLEEQHLLPALKKHKETKGLVAEALNDNRETRELLSELERTPKDSEAFGAKVSELQKVFQQHVRDDKKEFLPVVAKALTDEEASAVVEKIEDGKAQLEAAQRAEADERRAQAKREREQAEREQEKREQAEREQADRAQAKREQAEAADAAKGKARADAERNRKEAAAAQTGTSSVARKGDDGAQPQQAASQREERGAAEAEASAMDMVDAGVNVARTVMTASAEGARDLGKALRGTTSQSQEAQPKAETTLADPSMMELLSEQARHAMQATVAVGSARSLIDVARIQSDFMNGSLERMTQLNARYLAFVRDGIGLRMFPNQRR
ncbi:hemerythrin domain-containing protein [Cereibacter sphaeroides]|uniref:hemerythrin domain-containing protein n=1 Tax=Cereibacter sphaeroides TaxID=1063 RepID=UPI001F40E21D|nr:hemerythrin domain-containing protein [Cereibacter sphaeroides]MCE6960840.1 hemerythrin domain-containing protein [Cereibacter sphaeroides]MCE6969894.1 hemerythrin domain-containing protein [Cereibacter sphaeroides]MCE6974282.1 hemerythrin domain-containing protein [Cereibacter sphaeroides]